MRQDVSGSRIRYIPAESRLEDLFEKSDMKMENGNMGSESSKKLKCCRKKYIRLEDLFEKSAQFREMF